MSDDYLVDKRGAVDPDVARLETLLADARYHPRPHPRWKVMPFAIAASLAGLTVSALLVRGLLLPAWPVQRVAVDGDVSTGRLHVGAWLETDGQTRATLDAPGVGQLELSPQGRLKLVSTGTEGHRLRLERGQLHATVHAAPRQFQVETPAAVAVDLGCEYSLGVDAQGGTTLNVVKGSVSLEGLGHVTTVWAGAECAAVPGRGPGLPVRSVASARLKDAVRRFDHGLTAAADDIVASAEPGDGLTLWHLVQRTRDAARRRVIARLGEVTPMGACGEDRLEACLKSIEPQTAP
jgi:hypothetical protein